MNLTKVGSYVGVFLLGVLISFLATGGGVASTEDLQGSLRLQKSIGDRVEVAVERGERQQVDNKLVKNVKPLIKPLAGDKRTPKPTPSNNGGVCSVTTCDLMDRLNELSLDIGRPSGSLSSMLTVIDHNIRSVYDEIGYSTGSLSEQIRQLHNEVGYSSWTLESLAKLISNKTNVITNLIIEESNNRFSSWTMNAVMVELAAKNDSLLSRLDILEQNLTSVCSQ